MKIRLLSDVHQEFYEDRDLYTNKGEEVLVIAGDLNVGHDRCWSALKRFAEHTKEVIYVPGNHEYYRGDIAEFDDYLRRFSYGTSVHFLNPGRVSIGGVTFIGAALWSNFGNDHMAKVSCGRLVNDFKIINNFSTSKCADLYEQHAGYIKDQYEAVEGKKVIVTHFLPAVECIAAEFKGEYLINKYFANDLGGWISELDQTTWLYGHTHTPGEQTIGTTRLIANPYGYNKNQYYKECLIEV
jgi:predicted phosphodiesterase